MNEWKSKNSIKIYINNNDQENLINISDSLRESDNEQTINSYSVIRVRPCVFTNQ